jgi:hypothetical protein
VRVKDKLLVVAIVLGFLAGLIGVGVREPQAAALFACMWSFALAFIEWRRAWLWPLLLIAWLPLAIIAGAFPPQLNGWEWCPRGPVSPWAIALAITVGAFVFSAAGAATALIISFVLSIGPWANAPWIRYVKPALDWGGSAVAVFLVLYAALAIAQPLQPHGLGERYCWDEFCFYVSRVERVRTIPAKPHAAVARGVFYIVTAKMETPWWGRFDWSADAVYVVSYNGARFEHSADGQRAEDALTQRSSACHQIPGAAETETVVFDLPEDVVQPRLIVRDTQGFEGFLGGMRSDLHYVKPAFNLRYE